MWDGVINDQCSGMCAGYAGSHGKIIDMNADRKPNGHNHEHGKHDHSEGGSDHQSHHAHMVADFRRRFWISLGLRGKVFFWELARGTHMKMVQNLWWATGYNALAIPLAAGVLFPIGFLLPPAAGALVMSLSTVIVAINAKMLSGDR